MRQRLALGPGALVRMVPIWLAAAYLVPGLLVPREWWESNEQWYWALIFMSAALALYKGPLDLHVVLIQSILMITVDQEGAIASEVTQVAMLINLFHLASGPRGRLAVGTAAVTVATTLNLIDVPWDSPSQDSPSALPLVTVAACIVAAPVLLGLHQQALRDAARQAEERVSESERRHELEKREATANERAAISRELHDLVAHHVASIVLRVGAARHVAGETDPRIRAVLDDVHSTAAAALEDLRRLVGVLRDGERTPIEPLTDPAGLTESLNELVRRTRRAGPTVTAELGPGLSTLDSVRRLAVLRLVQEALTNALKHAGPDTAVTVRVRLTAKDAVEVEVADNGGPGGVRVPGGHGITGMRERVELLGGSLLVGPEPEGGWRVFAVLPGNEERG
ncbi:sensor histidine kinase [Allokutzneria oryzae]|uniref:histidine kinase n=1 Tax=Allokutzneria oryzae TaxID=1378989 RepID=A0ABV6A872_9PSEU